MKLKELQDIQELAKNGEATLSEVMNVLCEFFMSQSAAKDKQDETTKKIIKLLVDLNKKMDLIVEQIQHPIYKGILELENEMEKAED